MYNEILSIEGVSFLNFILKFISSGKVKKIYLRETKE